MIKMGMRSYQVLDSRFISQFLPLASKNSRPGHGTAFYQRRLLFPHHVVVENPLPSTITSFASFFNTPPPS